MERLPPVRRTLWLCRSRVNVHLSLFSPLVVPWEKIESTLHSIHPGSSLQLLSSRLNQRCGSFAALVPIMESLKVIAFDKSTVNLNLSSGKQSAYIPH
jgi:hypothetical protein